MRLPDDAEVSDELWDEVIESMMQRVDDKVPAIRGFAVRALARFVNDGENGDIINLFLRALSEERNSDVRKVIILSMPPSATTSTAIVGATLDVSESVRKASYTVLANKFPLQSLSIKLRTIILQRGLSDRSSSVTKECLNMLKDEWLAKCCSGDPIALLRYLDVETYELVGESVMQALLKEGLVKVQDGQSIRQYLASCERIGGECSSGIQLMEAEAALYWKNLCMHLQSEAQAKGTDAATTTGTEAAVYASEASDSNDLLDVILPVTVSDYISLVKAHLSAGANYRFVARQLLLLGAMLDFSDSTNRKVASAFVQELLLKPLEFEVDDEGNKIIIGDGINIGGDGDWAKAVSELARKVHASPGEFESVVTTAIEELARPCRERTADFMQWMHCLAVIGLLLENIKSLRALQGKAMESSEILNSLLLPGAKQVHVDVQRVATRCLCLYALLERRPSEEIVKQLRMSFISGPGLVSIMASKALFDLATWHGPEEVDRAIGIDMKNPTDEKSGFASLNLQDLKDDMSIGLLDLLHSGLDRDDWGTPIEPDDHESVHATLGEGFAKILLLSEKYTSISSNLHPVILRSLISLYFSDNTKELLRLKQCLSVFFEHYPALSLMHKKCVSRAFIPVMQSMWPGIYDNPGGSTVQVSKMRKRAILVARFMLQMMQTPLFSNESKDEQGDEKSPESVSGSVEISNDFDSGEEGLAIRIATEIVNFPDKKTAAGKSYISALCKVAVLTQFRPLEQDAIKCMRGLLNGMISSASADKEAVKELHQMVTRLTSLDKHPDQEFSQEQSNAVFGKLGLDGNFKVDTSAAIPPTPAAPRSTRAAPVRRRARRKSSDDEDDDDNEALPALEVPITPSLVSGRSQRASKAIAMTKMSIKTTIQFSDNEDEEESEVTSDDSSDESCDGLSE